MIRKEERRNVRISLSREKEPIGRERMGENEHGKRNHSFLCSGKESGIEKSAKILDEEQNVLGDL